MGRFYRFVASDGFHSLLLSTFGVGDVQHHAERLRMSESALQHMQRVFQGVEGINEAELRRQLGEFTTLHMEPKYLRGSGIRILYDTMFK